MPCLKHKHTLSVNMYDIQYMPGLKHKNTSSVNMYDIQYMPCLKHNNSSSVEWVDMYDIQYMPCLKHETLRQLIWFIGVRNLGLFCTITICVCILMELKNTYFVTYPKLLLYDLNERLTGNTHLVHKQLFSPSLINCAW